jgi:hypothetical protein
MAVENRGGMRPNAPQNNPANINLLGGNGQSGSGTQAATYIPGMGYGQGKALMQQQEGARLAGPTPTPKAAAPRVASATPLTEARSLTAPSDFPDEDISTGSTFGNTPGPESLMMPREEEVINDPDLDLVREYFPVIELWAEQIDTSQGTKDYVNYLRTIL